MGRDGSVNLGNWAGCFYFWSAANGYRQNDPEATEQLYREMAPTFLEDKEMVEAQQKRLDEFGDRGLVDIASDANRMHMRRIVERLIAAERSAMGCEIMPVSLFRPGANRRYLGLIPLARS